MLSVGLRDGEGLLAGRMTYSTSPKHDDEVHYADLLCPMSLFVLIAIMNTLQEEGGQVLLWIQVSETLTCEYSRLSALRPACCRLLSLPYECNKRVGARRGGCIRRLLKRTLRTASAGLWWLELATART